MNLARVLGAVLLAGAVLAAFPWSPAQAQGTGTYEVKKRDGLYSISGKFRVEGATRFQVAIAIYRANPEAFPDGNIHMLKEGQVLRIPSRDQVLAMLPAEASREWQSLTSKPVPSPAGVAAVKPSSGAKAPAKPSAAASLAPEAAEKRYQEGLALEGRGDQQGALSAFLEAGAAGHGLAQRKLGQIYDKGNAATPRDYQAALRWYQKAREQGVEMDKPLPRMAPP